MAAYEKHLSSQKAVTRNLYLRTARNFLDFAQGDLSRSAVAKYVTYLQDAQKYADGTVNFHFRVIRTLFERNKIEWPFNRGESPQIRENKITAWALDPADISDMIRAANKEGEPSEKAFLALSSTYGLRRTEIVSITQEDISFQDRIIHIATAKHGRERSHLIPEQIVPALKSYDFSDTRTEWYLNLVWHRLESCIGMTHTEGVGWHSIRRTVNTLLREKLPGDTVNSFMRWKQKTSGDMGFRYSAQGFVSRHGKTTRLVGESLDTDTKIFKVHPFIGVWVE